MKMSLAAARVNRNLTMDEASQEIGCSRMALYNWETGKSKMFLGDFIRVIRVYKVNFDDIDVRGLKGCEGLSDE